MHRCLQLAQLGASHVAPNPLVGAVIVVNDQIIGEGYHERYGQAHAEPNAIHAVTEKELLQQATLYVSLEPCSHYGKTPPCADLIVQMKIPRVVIGTLDPNPKVSGRGVKIMQEAGIEVVVGVLEKECYELNKRFFIFQNQKRPFILLKWAQTYDGFIDTHRQNNTEQALQISNEITRQLTHKMRSENQAIMVATNTVLLDNPSLTVRFWSGRNPIRIILDRRGRIPFDYQVMNGLVKTIVFTEKETKSRENLLFVSIQFDDKLLQNILKALFELQINAVLVEGGSKLLQSFINAGLWDEAHVEVSNQQIHEGVAAPTLSLAPDELLKIDNHSILNYTNKHFKSPT